MDMKMYDFSNYLFYLYNIRLHLTSILQFFTVDINSMEIALHQYYSHVIGLRAAYFML